MRTWWEWEGSEKNKRLRKRNCPNSVLERRVSEGAEAVELIRPDFEIPDFEMKLASLIESLRRA
jgi:hypothetical protein